MTWCSTAADSSRALLHAMATWQVPAAERVGRCGRAAARAVALLAGRGRAPARRQRPAGCSDKGGPCAAAAEAERNSAKGSFHCLSSCIHCLSSCLHRPPSRDVHCLSLCSRWKVLGPDLEAARLPGGEHLLVVRRRSFKRFHHGAFPSIVETLLPVKNLPHPRVPAVRHHAGRRPRGQVMGLGTCGDGPSRCENNCHQLATAFPRVGTAFHRVFIVPFQCLKTVRRSRQLGRKPMGAGGWNRRPAATRRSDSAFAFCVFTGFVATTVHLP